MAGDAGGDEEIFVISRLGLLYIDYLREQDVDKRISILQKIEDREQTLFEKEQAKSFAEYAVDIDKQYHDRVFWMTENSGMTLEDVKRLTLRERIEFQNRLIKKINDQNRSYKQSQREL